MNSVRVGQFYPKADSALADSEFRSLVGATTALTREQLDNALSSAGFVGEDLEHLASGTLNDLWRFRSGRGQYVLKAARAADDGALAIEAAVSDILSAHSVDHPKVRALDESLSRAPFAFAVIDYIDGRSMRELDGDESAVQRVLPQVAGAFKALHGISGLGFGLTELRSGALEGTHATWRGYLSTRLAEHLDLLLANGIVTGAEAQELLVCVEPVDPMPEPRLLHGDCGPHNIMVGPSGRPVLIDWEDATFGDPEFELALWATFNPTRRWPLMLNAYHGTAEPLSAQFWRYFARITIAKVVVRTRLGYPDVTGRPSRVDRIRQSLDGLRKTGA